MEDVPAEVRRALTVHLVSSVAEVLRLALPEPSVRRPAPALAGYQPN